MHELRTYRASSIAEAILMARREMGEAAEIVDSRTVALRRWVPFLRARTEVEVTARVRQKSRAGRKVGVTAVAKRQSDGEAQLVTREPQIQRDDSIGLTPHQLAERLERELLCRVDPSVSDAGIELSPSLERLLAAPGSTSPSGKPNEVFADRTNVPALTQFGSPAELTTRLDSIQRMLESLNRTRLSGDAAEVPPELFQLYAELLDADVEDDVARDVTFRLKRHVKPEQLADHDLCKSLLCGLVESDFRIASPIKPTPGRRRVVALVGPTGVGKTTTIAKLAANFRLRDGIKIGLITVDTYRVAAVEQLRTYAEIIDLPMKVVTSPLEMRRALDELVGLDLILIDTGGRSPRDELKIQELKTLLAEAQVDEVHLVLSLTAGISSLKNTVEKFSPANTTALILTKLDEAAGMGSLLTAARKLPLPVSYLTTGQDVPDDIETAHASRMARLVLGQEKLS